MTEGASLLMELYRKHMYALRDKDEPLRERLYNLICEFEWAFPEIKTEVDELYPTCETKQYD